MSTSHGFELLREQNLPEIKSKARLYRHAKTGAELLSLVNDDENKVFGAAFRTPPTDSTGIAHILEHSVLCGSKKYPIKEPFVQLMKGSLNTFLNAMTYSDKTVYPVASQNLQDFYNLVDVYLDAVFHPRLGPHILEQEGWHYELESPDAPLIYKGVVFNEMKGAYSAPDRAIYDWSQRSLFPDNTYGFDSGGDPAEIPDLTYPQFEDFHRRYYHPSNARLFFYGNDDPDQRLRLLDAVLSGFDRIEVDSTIALQPRFSAPKELTRTFTAGDAEDGGNRAAATVNWMLGEVKDAETALGLKILEQILIGTPASPLRKALIDSGLGGDLAGGGFDDGIRQFTFSTGLKEIDPADAGKVEALVLDTLKGLADQGIDPLTVEASLNTAEFAMRELNTGSFPRGIAVMINALNTWLYDRDPLAPLAFDAPLAAIKARVAKKERYFEDLIRRFLLTNTHRTRVLLVPDPEHDARLAAAEQARLDAVRAKLGKAELAGIVENTLALKRLQETPDPPEALAKIPLLKRSDLPLKNKLIPVEQLTLGDTPALYHDLFTSGIVYLDIAFDLHALPAELVPYVPLFGRALLETGAGGQDFVALSQRIGRSTGGISARPMVSAVQGKKAASTHLLLRGKAMPDKTGELLRIIRDVLTTARLDNRERFGQIVLEEKASAEAMLSPAGHRYASARLASGFHEAGWFREQTVGFGYLGFLRKLADEVERNWPAVQAALERIRTILVNRAGMIANVTTDAGNWKQFSPQLADFVAGLPRATVARAEWPAPKPAGPQGLTIPTQVNYVAKGIDLYQAGYRPSGAASVVEGALGTGWLWQKIRVQGGAYGGHGTFDWRSGLFTFVSYRDPNLLGSLDVYDQAADWLRTTTFDDDELTRGIIGAIGAIDDYELPDSKGLTSLQWHLLGETDAMRQKRREEVLATSPADFKAFAAALDHVGREGRVVVLGSEQAIAAANKARPGFLSVSKVL